MTTNGCKTETLFHLKHSIILNAFITNVGLEILLTRFYALIYKFYHKFWHKLLNNNEKLVSEGQQNVKMLSRLKRKSVLCKTHLSES